MTIEDDFTARLMNDLAPELLDFIKTKVNSFVKWDMVRFLHDNPNTTDTAENIARYAGRNVAIVEPELRELVQSGVVSARQLGDMTIYSLSPDKVMRNLVERFVTACNDSNFRVKAVYHIIRGMR